MNDAGSRSLTTAAHQIREAASSTWLRAIGDWLADEAVLARHAEHRAEEASIESMSDVHPAYAPSTRHALEVAAARLALARSAALTVSGPAAEEITP